MPARRVSIEMLEEMKEEARCNLAEPDSPDWIIANYDYPATVSSRDLFDAINELIELRKRGE